MSLACPVCTQPLEPFHFNSTELDVCQKGCGVWFDWDELREVEQSDTLEAIDAAFPGVYTPKALKEAMAEKAKNCVRHPGQALTRYQWNLGSGLVFDKCPQCEGLWLDAGELEGYAGMIKKFQANKPDLTPALKAKLDAAQVRAEQRLESTLDTVTHQTITWDIGLIDDALRGLIKLLITNRRGL